ncbi:hypothetical protein BDM02DRAFT_253709 [Thelephora ganbajun]|uniref:Uncharacterized protein n=1 Tax=Thelephora ganbajun TaxID=370292 RepID=A0ACB6ZA87_THEGA|nr:hypothetical protein BDM02DRAFT_253709 [Thelephora ganbajun]
MEHVRMGKVIKIQDVAFITFQAFLLYLYTNSIQFASFGSKENRKSRSPEIAWTPEGEIPKPSPKSIYRLADKYDVPGLKKAAFKSISSGLQKCDIVQEVFSVFTSRYNEIRTMEVNHLLGVWLSGSEKESKVVREKLEEKIDSYAAGELKHAVDAISSIWEISSKGEQETPSKGERKTPSKGERKIPSKGEREIPSKGEPIPSGSVPQSKPFGLFSSWFSLFDDSDIKFVGCNMRPSLVKSIKEGFLLDQKCWARRSQDGVIEPIYFSSAITGAELQGLDTHVT